MSARLQELEMQEYGIDPFTEGLRKASSSERIVARSERGCRWMHITMVKKRLADGSECRKCQEATAHLRSRGLWEHVTEIVWAHEDDHSSHGMVLSRHHGVDRAPFFIVRDDDGEAVYVSVLQLVRDRFDKKVTTAQEAKSIDIDDIGGI